MRRLNSTDCRPQNVTATKLITSITNSSNISEANENELDGLSKLRIKPTSTCGTQSSLKVLPFANFYSHKSTFGTDRYDNIVQSVYELSESLNNGDETRHEQIVNNICLEDCIIMAPGLVKPLFG